MAQHVATVAPRRPNFQLPIVRPLFVLLSVATRLGLVASILAIPRAPALAGGLAAMTTVTSTATAWLRADLVGRETARAWAEVVSAIRRWGVPELEAMREDEIGVLTLLDAVRETALTRATGVPDLVATGLAVVALCGALASQSLLALVLGGSASLVLLVALVPLRRRQHKAAADGFEAYAPLSRDVRALIGGAAELRVQNTELAVSAAALQAAGRVAAAERVTARHGAVSGLVPAMIAISVVIVPRGWLEGLSSGGRLFEHAGLGAALVSTSMAFARAIEHRWRVAPYLRAFERVQRGAHTTVPRAARHFASVKLDRVALRHDGGAVAPDGLSFELDRGGLALVGANGGGKSTAVKIVLGLVTPTAGEVHRGEASEAQEITYLPQRPFIEAGESLRWHLALAGVAANAPWLSGAFERMGFDRVLHQRVTQGDPLDLSIGTFSGGERQRFFLARTLGRPAALVVLDEPEAALDDDGRARLGRWLEELALDRVLLVVAHETSFVPATFARATCSSRQA